MRAHAASLWIVTLLAGGLAAAAGCHLAGGTEDLYIDPDFPLGGGGSTTSSGTGGTTTTSSTSSGGAGGGEDIECASAADCETKFPGQLAECEEWDCDALTCKKDSADLYKVCNGAWYCDGLGVCVECISDSDTPCPNGGLCQSKQCVAATCNDQQQNGNETDIDCGGFCSPCALGKTCGVWGDCISKFCTGVCSACSAHGNCPTDHFCALDGDLQCHPKLAYLAPCSYDYECITNRCSPNLHVCNYVL